MLNVNHKEDIQLMAKAKKMKPQISGESVNQEKEIVA